MGSLLTNRRIDLTFHSATARMSEGNAVANEALRVEFSTFLKLSVGLRTSQDNWLPGKFTANATWGLRANSGTSRPHLHTATGAEPFLMISAGKLPRKMESHAKNLFQSKTSRNPANNLLQSRTLRNPAGNLHQCRTSQISVF